MKKSPASAPKATAKAASVKSEAKAKSSKGKAKAAVVAAKAKASKAKEASARELKAKELKAQQSAVKNVKAKDVKKVEAAPKPQAQPGKNAVKPVAQASKPTKPVSATTAKGAAPAAVAEAPNVKVGKATPPIASGSSSPQTNVGIVTQKKPSPAAPAAKISQLHGSAQVSAKSAPPRANENKAPDAASKVAPAKVEVKAATKPGAHRTGFRSNEYIVYPAHGVGQIVAIEEQEVAGFKLELFVISFAKDKMTLKVPLPKVLNGAIRKLADPDTVKKSLDTLSGRARVKRTMWSRRAQEYEAKINSGDLGSIAEVVRDLYRSEAQPEQSYSERQLYEAALDRMAREIAAVNRIIENEALKLIEACLQKGPRRGSKTDVVEVMVEAEIGEAA